MDFSFIFVLFAFFGDALKMTHLLVKYSCPLSNNGYLIPEVSYYLAGTPNFPSICPSLVYIADMHCTYKSNVPFTDQENII